MSRLNIPAKELNAMFPIEAIRIYPHGLELLRSSRDELVLDRVRKKRGCSVRVTRRSLHKLAFLVTNCNVRFYSVLTVTFGPNYPIDGARVKSLWSKFLTYMRRAFGDFSYFWFIEFQSRQSPHFHLITSLTSPSRIERELFASIWSKVSEPYNLAYSAVNLPSKSETAVYWQYTQENVEKQHRRARNWEALRSKEGAARYAVKYATKSRQKVVPQNYRNVGRFWGHSKDVKLPDPGYAPTNEKEVRYALQLLGRDFNEFDMLPRYIFVETNLTGDTV